jgi:hypothetical protein
MNSHLSTCVGTQSPKYLEMAQGHISLSPSTAGLSSSRSTRDTFEDVAHDDEDDDDDDAGAGASAAGQEEIGPSQLQDAPTTQP